MEQRYKLALEIILALCEKDGYTSAEDIKLICKTTLAEESGDEDVCT